MILSKQIREPRQLLSENVISCDSIHRFYNYEKKCLNRVRQSTMWYIYKTGFIGSKPTSRETHISLNFPHPAVKIGHRSANIMFTGQKEPYFQISK